MSRRTVLKGIGAGAAIGMSGLGSASATTGETNDVERSIEMRRAAETFATDDAIQQALAGYGESIKAQLEAEGISTDLDAADFDEVRSFPDEEDGVATAHIVAEREDADREIEVHVLPQADRSFAVEKTDSGNRHFEDGDVQPMIDCSTNTYCDGYCQCMAPTPDCSKNCHAGFEIEERCCLYADGSYDCETLNQDCTDSCPGTDCA
ncbi:hypothetical protein [Halorussus pelagicus]|uniref:hypothetical protein n=1 Tax=Halorussus pelagicus TaxID=2505977 RepID=UPI000FFC0001|nr:hypothetical protein [Halorussus pelagicus]